jgi:drug/metabolite transporter (DMT)-like permease
MADSERLLADSMFALGAVALWGLAFPLIQDGLESFPPVFLGFLRFVIGSTFLMAFVLMRFSAEEVVSVVRKEWKPLLALGMLYVTIPNIAQNIGLQHGTSSIASVIQSSGPMMTLFFAVILLRERLTRMKGFGTLISMLGTVLLVASGGFALGDQDFVSNMLILMSAASYGLAWVSAKRMLERNSPMLVIGLGLVFGTIMLGSVVPFEDISKSVYSFDSLANLAVLGVFCAGVSSVLYLRSLERQEVSRIAFLIYLMPVFASVFAWLLRGEGVEVWTVICGAVIVLGIMIANRPDNRTPKVEGASENS